MAGSNTAFLNFYEVMMYVGVGDMVKFLNGIWKSECEVDLSE